MPPQVPLEILFGSSARATPALSPGGRHIAYLAPRAGVPAVWAGTRGTGFRPVTPDRLRVKAFIWAGDGRHLLCLADDEGDENSHVHAVDVRTGTARDLTPFDGVQAFVVALSRERPTELLIEMNRRTPEFHDAYRVDLVTGRLELAARNPGCTDWIADRDLYVLGAVERDPSGSASILVRESEQAGWRTLYRVGPEDAESLAPLGFAADGSGLFVLSARDARSARLLRVDVRTGESTTRYEDPDGYDVTEVALHPATGEPRLAVVTRERDELVVLDPAIAEDVYRCTRHARGDAGLLGTDRADAMWLLQDNVDDGPARFHRYNRRTGRFEFLFSHLPELEPYPLAPTKPFSFTARDGLTIHGYLTIPRRPARGGFPTVLTVHGGPWSRDRWGFRAESQWLADRGYLCVRVNFRGSTGYGKDFRNAGDREWGGRMQDDLTDAVGKLVRAGLADPRRIAIYGSSYGGYAALAGAAFTPELYRCTVAVAGPADLGAFIRSVPETWGPVAADLRRRIGDPVADADFLWRRSPMSRIEDIRVPVLIAQGANDPRVRLAESDRFVAALTAHGVRHEYLTFDDEGHGFTKPANRIAFHAATERFLAEHLGGR